MILPCRSSRKVAGTLSMPYLTASLFCQPLPSKYCGQGISLVFKRLFQLLLVPIKADADDFKAVAVMLVVSLDDIGQFAHTWGAPGRPEINQYQLAPSCL